MGKTLAATTRTVMALSDARRYVEQPERLTDPATVLGTMHLLRAYAWAEVADLGRRMHQYAEDTGAVSVWLERRERELMRDLEALFVDFLALAEAA